MDDEAHLGRTLLIANPVAQSGRGAHAADMAKAWCRDHSQLFSSVETRLTQAAGHATQIAADARDYDTVIVSSTQRTKQ